MYLLAYRTSCTLRNRRVGHRMPGSPSHDGKFLLEVLLRVYVELERKGRMQ